jgi:hypothetical protein
LLIGLSLRLSTTSEYSEETLDNFRLVTAILRAGADMVKRVDYLLNGDEEEDKFLELWADRFEIDKEAEESRRRAD